MTTVQPVWANSGKKPVLVQREKSSPALRLDLRAWKFSPGYCTWYVASKRHITWGGNAGQWAVHAKKQGYVIGSVPKKTAIYVSTTESSRGCRDCGHVAYVEKVERTRFLVSEMNYQAWNMVSFRWIKGNLGTFIY